VPAGAVVVDLAAGGIEAGAVVMAEVAAGGVVVLSADASVGAVAGRAGRRGRGDGGQDGGEEQAGKPGGAGGVAGQGNPLFVLPNFGPVPLQSPVDIPDDARNARAIPCPPRAGARSSGASEPFTGANGPCAH